MAEISVAHLPAHPRSEQPHSKDPAPFRAFVPSTTKLHTNPTRAVKVLTRSGGSQQMPSSEEMHHMLPNPRLPNSRPSLLCRRSRDQMVPFPRRWALPFLTRSVCLITPIPGVSRVKWMDKSLRKNFLCLDLYFPNTEPDLISVLSSLRQAFLLCLFSEQRLIWWFFVFLNCSC